MNKIVFIKYHFYNQGLSEIEIEKLQADLPFKLSTEVRQLYQWKNGTIICHFYNPLNLPKLEQKDIFSMLGIIMKEVANELRRINNATHGFYLANILERQYYYCGTEWEDVKRVLREDLGIGVEDRH